MKTKKVIVFDLEWNSGRGGEKLNEILQIGAVKLERFGGAVSDTFRAFIKPAVHKRFHKAAQGLAFSMDEVEGGAPFAAVLEQFLAWCGEDCLFASWGPNDLRELQSNVAFWRLDARLPTTVFDIQAAAGLLAGARGEVALRAMADYYGLPDTLDFHDALNDAFYAAMIGQIAVAMGGEALIRACSYPDKGKRRPGGARPPQGLYAHVIHTGQRRGGFPQEQTVLNSRSIRCQACPFCGRPLYISHWYPLGAHSYLSRATCHNHGCQYFWAILSVSNKGKWRGKVHTLKAGPDIEKLYRSCDRAGAVFCKRNPRYSQQWDSAPWPGHSAAEGQ